MPFAGKVVGVDFDTAVSSTIYGDEDFETTANGADYVMQRYAFGSITSMTARQLMLAGATRFQTIVYSILYGHQSNENGGSASKRDKSRALKASRFIIKEGRSLHRLG